MKMIFMLLSVVGLVACSSTPEATEAGTEPTVTDATATNETTPSTPTETPTEVTADTGGDAEPAPPANETMSDGGGFPPIEGTERITANCLSGSDQRVISVIDRQGGGCGTVYTKHGNKQTVAIANNDMSYCDKVFDKIKANLSAAGFDCGGGTAAAPAQEEAPAASNEEAASE